MTNSTEVDEIDTVLRQMFMDAGVKLTDIGWQLSDDVREKAKSALQKMMIEAIGADEKFRIRSSKGRPAVSMGDQIWKSGRNQLRAEIRAKLGIKSKEV